MAIASSARSWRGADAVALRAGPDVQLDHLEAVAQPVLGGPARRSAGAPGRATTARARRLAVAEAEQAGRRWSRVATARKPRRRMCAPM